MVQYFPNTLNSRPAGNETWTRLRRRRVWGELLFANFERIVVSGLNGMLQVFIAHIVEAQDHFEHCLGVRAPARDAVPQQPNRVGIVRFICNDHLPVFTRFALNAKAQANFVFQRPIFIAMRAKRGAAFPVASAGRVVEEQLMPAYVSQGPDHAMPELLHNVLDRIGRYFHWVQTATTGCGHSFIEGRKQMFLFLGFSTSIRFNIRSAVFKVKLVHKIINFNL
jgi:hypothetical protein